MAFDPPFLPHFMNQMTNVTWPQVALDLGALNLNFSLTFGSKLPDLGVYKFMYLAHDF